MQKGTSWITVELRSPDYDREWVHIQAYPLNIENIEKCFAQLERDKKNGVLKAGDYRIGFMKIAEYVTHEI